MTTDERVARLERENRRMKLGGIFVVMAASAVLLMGQVSIFAARTLEANRILLKDPTSGAVRAEFAALRGGQTVLVLYDQPVGNRPPAHAIVLGTNDAGLPTIRLSSGGAPRADLSVDASDTTRLRMLDRDGALRAQVVVARDGSPSMALMTKGGKLLWTPEMPAPE